MAHRQELIRRRTALPAFFYLLLAATWPAGFFSLRGGAAALVMVLCLWLLLRDYQQPTAQRSALNISLVLTAGCYFWPPFLWFFPLVIGGMYHFKNLNGRTWAAMLTGVAVVQLFRLTEWVYRTDSVAGFAVFPDWEGLLSPFTLSAWNVRTVFLVALLLITCMRVYSLHWSEKTRVIHALGYGYIVTAALWVLLCFQAAGWVEWLSVLQALCALLFAYFFALSRQAAWLFLLTLVFLLAQYAWEALSVWVLPAAAG
jgi:hypothetical protein